jgi:hypothetical protein
MTFGKLLTEHKSHFGRTHKQQPAEFTALWDWAEKHGIVQQAQWDCVDAVNLSASSLAKEDQVNEDA